MNRDLLLEIGTEEIPARFMPGILDDLNKKACKWFDDLHISYHSIQVYGTPRRITLLVKELSEKQQDQTIEARGPAVKAAYDEHGQLTKAGEGFARGQGVSAQDLQVRKTDAGEYIYAIKHISGQATQELLGNLDKLILNLQFPKNMRWGTYDIRFVRPLKWLLCLYGKEIITLEIAGQTTSNITYGHRFLYPQPIHVNEPSEYLDKLENAFVIVEQEKRKTAILKEIQRVEQEKQVRVFIDEELLEEVIYLVEYPTALMGNFEQEFLQIPSQVLITSMKEHQRYFPVKDEQDHLLPHFVTIRNGNQRSLETVQKGNEKVLRARLADARFFYEEDKKVSIDTFNNKLQSIVYHEELGTITEKVDRIQEVSIKLASNLGLNNEQQQHLSRITQICKFDLVTQMVYEFPELQGIMGKDYAKLAGETVEVANGIFEHYLPRFAGDILPSNLVNSIASISDKIDTIVGCFGIGIVPTGSQDPYALRRQATGICQIIKANEIELPIDTLIQLALEIFDNKGLLKKDKEVLQKEIFEFFLLRVKNIMQEEGIRYDCIDATITENSTNINEMIARGHALQKALEFSWLSGVIDTFNRVKNISSKSSSTEYSNQHFTEDAEIKLAEAFCNFECVVTTKVDNRDYIAILELINELKPNIDYYFDKVMVMDQNLTIQQNRLGFLKALHIQIAIAGDLSKIINK
ncbi:glycine--tRNA ligase subunit beta [Desulfuribacillus stibiiarsenatis]|uniref:Glycine--tRNA ligase beta subunit n=1 Tax=Desulfuribacillus stibiiarsenatis TaxID=1390249 RepID=A0A1E5L7P5_9FIRM|nr:glycine--tRNA ligase subunit beta [Desulfuribacillus stibiiarsenatis]OEH86165.1 glycine--tRNA ligase subunit beta [Desulfuribacillus stibiiarsenatis]